MATKEEKHFEIASYILGISSIVFGVLQPLLGIGLGITGLFLVKGKKDELSRKARKFNTLGLIIGIIFIALSFVAGFYFASKGITNLPTY